MERGYGSGLSSLDRNSSGKNIIISDRKKALGQPVIGGMIFAYI